MRGILDGIMGSENKSKKKNLSNPAYIGMFVVIGAILIFGSIMLGKSDSGEIDVSSTINDSNQANIDDGGDAKDSIGTIPNALKDLPNGGLVPQDSQDTVIAPEPSIDDNNASSTASSTEMAEDGENTEEEESEEVDEETDEEAPDIPEDPEL